MFYSQTLVNYSKKKKVSQKIWCHYIYVFPGSTFSLISHTFLCTLITFGHVCDRFHTFSDTFFTLNDVFLFSGNYFLFVCKRHFYRRLGISLTCLELWLSRLGTNGRKVNHCRYSIQVWWTLVQTMKSYAASTSPYCVFKKIQI